MTGARLKNAYPRVPVVLIQNGSKAPPHFEEHVDVVIDESTLHTARTASNHVKIDGSRRPGRFSLRT